MDPMHHDEIPALELPEKQAGPLPYGNEVPLNPPTAETATAVAVEQGAAPQMGMPQVGAAGPAPLTPVPQSPLQPIDNTIPSTPPTMTNLPQIAEDTDLIEKEWVEKAKEIVEGTKHDPRLQNQEINKIKADYMKKRYNKDLKLQS